MVLILNLAPCTKHSTHNLEDTYPSYLCVPFSTSYITSHTQPLSLHPHNSHQLFLFTVLSHASPRYCLASLRQTIRSSVQDSKGQLIVTPQQLALILIAPLALVAPGYPQPVPAVALTTPAVQNSGHRRLARSREEYSYVVKIRCLPTTM